MTNIVSLTSDIKPDSWLTFYLFYFTQGIGSDACFQSGEHRLIHILVGSLMSPENNGKILSALKRKHELAVGEFMHVLTQLMLDDSDAALKASAGAALVVESDSGKAKSCLFTNDEEIKAAIVKTRSLPNVKQLY